MLQKSLAIRRCTHLFLGCLLLITAATSARAQHDADVYGVKIGMDVPTALETAFRNSGRPTGKEKPDGKKNEGKGNKDIRVLYKDLKEGSLQVVFAEGKVVKEIVMEYKKPLLNEDLRLPETTSTYGNSSGETRKDDRYSVGFTSDQKRERYWWRDEKTPAGYRVRIGFVSANLNKGGLASKEIVRKIVAVHPDDVTMFVKSLASE